MAPSGKWGIAIHGGAGAMSRQSDPAPYQTALQLSIDAAYNVLADGYSDRSLWAQDGVALPSLSVLAALAAVESLEANPLFNAGKGAVLNEHALVENEAAVMDGTSLRSGAVCGLTTLVHPARLAAVVQSESKYQFLGFSAAERYANRFPTLLRRQPNSWFITERRSKLLTTARNKATTTQTHEAEVMEKPGETVGATVCDGEGHVACVTSTGGVTNKCDGRIGDTPVIGAGSYASDASCAVSGTGIGEQFLRFSAASRVVFGMELAGMSLKDSMHSMVHKVFPAETGGFVGVTNGGEIVMEFNSEMMFRGCRNWRGQHMIGVW